MCNNTVGSYRCECPLGFAPDSGSQNPLDPLCVGEKGIALNFVGIKCEPFSDIILKNWVNQLSNSGTNVIMFIRYQNGCMNFVLMVGGGEGACRPGMEDVVFVFH